MAEREMKRVEESFTTQVQILTQGNLNGYQRLFGGKLMAWMDIVAAVTARRHSGKNVTAHANDTVVITGEVIYVGRTSMDIRVCAYVENLDGNRKFINRAYFTMVALDENEKPTEVPGLIIETEDQQRRWDEAARRKSK